MEITTYIVALITNCGFCKPATNHRTNTVLDRYSFQLHYAHSRRYIPYTSIHNVAIFAFSIPLFLPLSNPTVQITTQYCPSPFPRSQRPLPTPIHPFAQYPSNSSPSSHFTKRPKTLDSSIPTLYGRPTTASSCHNRHNSPPTAEPVYPSEQITSPSSVTYLALSPKDCSIEQVSPPSPARSKGCTPAPQVHATSHAFSSVSYFRSLPRD